MSIHVVILAGGSGTRFWPLSRTVNPKQFLDLAGSGKNLIRDTVDRVSHICHSNNLWVVTNQSQAVLVRKHVPSARIIEEPVAKNTAASICLALMHIQKEDPDAVMVILPADHVVENTTELKRCLSHATDLAREEDVLVTIGIKPLSPHTGYGYIKRGSALKKTGCYKVARFYEKPNLERAVEYQQEGEYFWNSGMICVHSEVLKEALNTYLRDTLEKLERLDIGSPNYKMQIAQEYPTLESISIDIGVLEHAPNSAIIVSEDLGWSDVGSWDSWAERLNPDSLDNRSFGEALLLQSKGCVVHSKRKLTAVLGCEDLVIVDCNDALLVCSRNSVQDVKLVVEALKTYGREELI
jgi:mannose-1-phosphate guanylyltransferase